MTAKPLTKSDFFLSRRGSVAAIAREVADTLTEKGYKVFVQDYDIPLGASFINEMHEGIKNSRDLIILFTHDYEQSPYTRKEFTSFVAEQARSTEERYIIILRCEDVPLRGLLADNVYQDLVGIDDPAERKARIIAAVERQSQATPPPLRPFVDVPPRIVSFTGRSDELDKLDAILLRDKPAAVTQTIGRAAVRGLGGVGKTSLVVEYAHRFRNLYAGIWWCPAETRAGLLSSLSRLAVSLGVTTPEEADVEKAAKAALRRLAEQRARWLLVYDNVTSPDEIADFRLGRLGGGGGAGRAPPRGSNRFPAEPCRAQQRNRGTDACRSLGPPSTRARSCSRDVQANTDVLCRLCGESGKPHRCCSARLSLSEKRRRDL